MNKEKEFPEKKFWQKIRGYAIQAGIKVIYAVLLMYQAYRRKETPFWAKNVILGSIAYFLAPIDALPDLTPFLGFSDDLGILAVSLVTVGAYINQDVRTKARQQLGEWFGNYDASSLEEMDGKLLK